MNVEFERKNVQDVYTVRVQGRAVATVRLDRAMSKVYEAAITARDGLVGIRTEEYHVAMDASENETDHLVMVALSDAMFHVGRYILANEGAPPNLTTWCRTARLSPRKSAACASSHPPLRPRPARPRCAAGGHIKG